MIPLEIIAEGGLNHNGKLDIAMRLADLAKAADAEVFKIQTSVPSLEASANAPLAPYQAAAGFTSQLEMIQSLMLTRRDTLALAAHCEEIEIEFTSTPGDLDSLKFLVEEAGIKRVKIASCDIDNAPLLLAAGSTGLPIIMSTGCSTMPEIEAALEVFPRKTDITLLHCVSAYPCPLDQANVAAMAGLNVFGRMLGYSDHTIGAFASAAAVGIGAAMLEKHVTLDTQDTGPDHAMSMPMDEFKDYVKIMRAVRLACGTINKKIMPCELENRTASRKSIVAAKTIHAGDFFSRENITVKRPGGGRSPFDYWILLQHKATRDYAPDELID